MPFCLLCLCYLYIGVGSGVGSAAWECSELCTRLFPPLHTRAWDEATCTQTAFINQETISTIMHLHTRTEELEGVCGMHPHLFNKLVVIIKHGSFSDIGLNILFAPALNPLVYSMTGEHKSVMSMSCLPCVATHQLRACLDSLP